MPSTFIAVAGNIGAGKTVVQFLCKKYGLTPFFEPNDTNPYLEDFYKDMAAWSFHSQIYFLTHKQRLHRKLMLADTSAVQDRTIYEDAEIFARNLHLQGYLSARDYAVYRDLYETTLDTLRPPDVMLFLRCPVGTLKKRIGQRGRAMEANIPDEYLKRLNRLYDQWRKRYTLSPVIDLETDKLDYLTNLVDRLDVFAAIERYVGRPKKA